MKTNASELEFERLNWAKRNGVTSMVYVSARQYEPQLYGNSKEKQQILRKYNNKIRNEGWEKGSRNRKMRMKKLKSGKERRTEDILCVLNWLNGH